MDRMCIWHIPKNLEVGLRVNVRAGSGYEFTGVITDIYLKGLIYLNDECCEIIRNGQRYIIPSKYIERL